MDGYFKPDKGLLLTDEELKEIVGTLTDKMLEHTLKIIARQVAKAQHAKSYPAGVSDGRRQVIEEIESLFSATNYHSPESGRGLVNSIDVRDWQAVKNR